MLRRLFPFTIAALALSITLAAASLWSFVWVGPSTAHRLSLAQGRLWIWSGQPGDHAASGPGFRRGGWTGDAIIWRPTLTTTGRSLVPVAPPTAAPGRVTHKLINGLSITIPVWIPLLITSAASLLCLPAWLRHRRALRAGACAGCGYDLRGLKRRCPECGRPIRSLIRRAVAALRAILSPSPEPPPPRPA